MTIYYSANTNGFYDSAVGYSSYPSDSIEITQDDYTKYLKELNSNNKVIAVSNGAISLVDKTPAPVTWIQIRSERDRLLAQSDWTQLSDFKGNNAASWATYRQQLRDIPQTFSTPDVVIFPNSP
jgi:hypothetical protein